MFDITKFYCLPSIIVSHGLGRRLGLVLDGSALDSLPTSTRKCQIDASHAEFVQNNVRISDRECSSRKT
jgi:hypothetical protein